MKIEDRRLVYHLVGPDGPRTLRRSFSSIEDLIELCLHHDKEERPDRVTVTGLDDDGQPFTLTLIFGGILICSHRRDC